MTIRDATPADLVAVKNVLDGAMLETDDVADAIDHRDVVVYCEDERVLGVLVKTGVSPVVVTAIAVRRSRRGQRIGTELIESLDGPVEATFDRRVEPFYRSLGFTVEPSADGRLRGRYAPD